jgi:hypothetical protein
MPASTITTSSLPVEKGVEVDKAFWQAIVESDYTLPPDYAVADLTPDLIEFLGSPDIDVRDPFGYMILAHWMIRDRRYSPTDLRNMAVQLVQNLAAGLGEKDTDTVFRRSFSALILSLIMHRDNQQPFFTETEIQNLHRWSLEYFAAEQDVRGYVPGKGWAHSVAHTADLFKFLARNRYLNAAELESILTAIGDKTLLPVPHLYIHSEDERLVSALIEILKREHVGWRAWDRWLDRFVSWKESWEEGDFVATIHAPWYNSKNLLRSLYFRLDFTTDLPSPVRKLKTKTKQVLKLFGQ